jgi:predicted RNA-binding Zn-ribbon protein involved in translation (DUF1610 family)
MAVASHDAGVEVVCPGCGETVLQKAMIPLLGEDGSGVRYLCPPCARALMVPPPAGTANKPAPAADQPALPIDPGPDPAADPDH